MGLALGQVSPFSDAPHGGKGGVVGVRLDEVAERDEYRELAGRHSWVAGRPLRDPDEWRLSITF